MDIQADTIIAGASIFVAACALGVTIWQSSVMRKHNRLSVKPALNIIENRHHDKEQAIVHIEYYLGNFGVGPAIIKDFILIYNDKEISRNNHTSYDAFMNKQENKFMNVSREWIAPNMIMSANQKITLLKFTYDNKTESDAEELIKNINVLVKYYSIYEDEVFVFDSHQSRQFH